MSRNWTEDDLKAMGFGLDGRKAGQPLRPARPAASAAPARIGNKYGAIRTEGPDPAGGTRLYDSGAGAALARALDLECKAGLIEDFFPEVSIPIGTNELGRPVRYRADAMVLGGVTEDGWLKVKFLDAKRGGHDTRTSLAKRAALRQRGLNTEIYSL